MKPFTVKGFIVWHNSSKHYYRFNNKQNLKL